MSHGAYYQRLLDQVDLEIHHSRNLKFKFCIIFLLNIEHPLQFMHIYDLCRPADLRRSPTLKLIEVLDFEKSDLFPSAQINCHVFFYILLDDREVARIRRD